MTELKVWRWGGALRNFGDVLGPELLRRMGYKVTEVPIAQADVITVGSVLRAVQAKGRPGTAIWGSGYSVPVTSVPKPMKYLAVRGAFTRDILGLDTETPLGDPGLLVSNFWEKSDTRYKIGWVPHYVDKTLMPAADITINVKDPVDTVIEQISSCETILTSSLHGLIIAESFGIPAMRVWCDKVVGLDFKWMDYRTAGNINNRRVELYKALTKEFPL